MPLKIATWNINSVRLRTRLVRRFLREHQPDVICLQEIKCRTELFPRRVFKELGYPYLAVNGQLGYHGVAIASRLPFTEVSSRGFCEKGDSRHQAVTIADGGRPITIHNFYVPAGGDLPDPALNEKFAHKLAFIEEMTGWLTGPLTDGHSILVGDLNIAPLEHDVWSHKQLLRVVSHTPVETEALERLRLAGGWVDALRHFVPADQKLYTWWSYRAPDWEAANKGRRLDHIWVTPGLAPRLRSIDVLRAARGWARPSDHVPVIAEIGDAAA